MDFVALNSKPFEYNLNVLQHLVIAIHMRNVFRPNYFFQISNFRRFGNLLFIIQIRYLQGLRGFNEGRRACVIQSKTIPKMLVSHADIVIA